MREAVVGAADGGRSWISRRFVRLDRADGADGRRGDGLGAVERAWAVSKALRAEGMILVPFADCGKAGRAEREGSGVA